MGSIRPPLYLRLTLNMSAMALDKMQQTKRMFAATVNRMGCQIIRALCNDERTSRLDESNRNWKSQKRLLYLDQRFKPLNKMSGTSVAFWDR